MKVIFVQIEVNAMDYFIFRIGGTQTL